jgi:hypothetical protein
LQSRCVIGMTISASAKFKGVEKSRRPGFQSRYRDSGNTET